MNKSKVTLSRGKSTTLTVKGSPAVSAKAKTVKFSSSNSKIATVTSTGKITAKKAGTCKITVTSIYNAKVKGTIKVTVSKKKQNAKITLEKKKATIAVGKTTTVKVKSLKGISAKGVKFASSNKKVATVDAKGKVTAKKKGSAVITVTIGKIKKTCKVTVK